MPQKRDPLRRTTRSTRSERSWASQSSCRTAAPRSRAALSNGAGIIAAMARKKRPESPTARGLDPRALEYSASVAYDWRLYPYDIRGSIAHAKMLGRQGIISERDARTIIRGLEEIEHELDADEFEFREDLEDIHLNIEVALREKIGDAGARLHTARSRNDQVATDLRMFVKDHSAMLAAALSELQGHLCDLAETKLDAVMPGYTHLQRAQPVLLAHHLLAYVEMF